MRILMDTLIENYGLWGLFASAFLSSTILPGGSEAVLAAVAMHDHHSTSAMLLTDSSWWTRSIRDFTIPL